MSDTGDLHGSPDDSRMSLYRAARLDLEWALRVVIPEAMGTLRSIAQFDHGDLAQKRAQDAIARIDAEVAARLEAGDAG